MQSHHRYIDNPFLNSWKEVSVSRQLTLKIFLDLLADYDNSIPTPCLTAISSKEQENNREWSIFQGTCSYLYLYIRLHRFFKAVSNDQRNQMRSAFGGNDGQFYQLTDQNYYLEKAKSQFVALREEVKKRKEKDVKISFCFSKASIFLCGIHLGHLTGDRLLFKQCLEEVLKYYYLIMSDPYKCQSQILYGVPGYLYILLEIQSFYQQSPIDETFQINLTNQVANLVGVILNQGIQGFEMITKQKVDLGKLPKNFRLSYLFSKSEYLGGAHGLAGVLNIIFLSLSMNKLPQELVDKIIVLCVPTVSFLLSQQVNGNLPTRPGSKSTNFVQFCHGAPAAVTSLLNFCLLFPDYAEKLKVKQHIHGFIEYIWRYGIIKKGYYGLCHGVSGNAYPLISPVCRTILSNEIGQFTKKAELMWQAQVNPHVAEQIRNYTFEDRFVKGVSDFPYSLMIGKAGDLCFCCDLILGTGGKQPGFDV